MFIARRCFRTERIWCSQELSSRNPASQGLLSFASPSGGRWWVAFPAHAPFCAHRFCTAASVAQARTASRAATPWPWRTCRPRITTPSCRWRTWRILSRYNFIHQQNWATCSLLKRVRLFRLFIAVGSRRENGSHLWVLTVLFSKKLVVAIWVSAVLLISSPSFLVSSFSVLPFLLPSELSFICSRTWGRHKSLHTVHFLSPRSFSSHGEIGIRQKDSLCVAWEPCTSFPWRSA